MCAKKNTIESEENEKNKLANTFIISICLKLVYVRQSMPIIIQHSTINETFVTYAAFSHWQNFGKEQTI